jgi:hypothetical protein
MGGVADWLCPVPVCGGTGRVCVTGTGVLLRGGDGYRLDYSYC